jgi:hypothetical protein
MIGGGGNFPENIARTNSRPYIDAITPVGVTPYSTSGAAGLSFMQHPWLVNLEIEP